MKKREHDAKGILSELLLGAVRIYGAAWLGFLVACVPLYILRGTWHDYATRATAEAVVVSAVSFFATMAVIVFFFARTDNAGRLDRRTALIRGIGSALICVLPYPITKGVVLTSVGGYYLGYLFEHDRQDHPTVKGMLPAALIALSLYAIAALLGYTIARRRHEKERAKLLSEEANRH